MYYVSVKLRTSLRLNPIKLSWKARFHVRQPLDDLPADMCPGVNPPRAAIRVPEVPLLVPKVVIEGGGTD